MLLSYNYEIFSNKLFFVKIYLYEIMARFLEPATMASVWQFGASGPMNPAISLNKNDHRLSLLHE